MSHLAEHGIQAECVLDGYRFLQRCQNNSLAGKTGGPPRLSFEVTAPRPVSAGRGCSGFIALITPAV